MILTRVYYLMDPEPWRGTKEEKELVEFCIEYIKTHSIKECKKVLIGDGIYYDNTEYVKMDIMLMNLSKEVLEVYNGNKRRN